MIRHLVKLCWNRKRAQALVAIEVFFSFLVVFAVMTVAVYNLDNYRRPLGFDYHDVLNVNVASLPEMAANVDGAPVSATEETRRLLREVRGLDAVEGVAGMAVPAFDLTGMSSVVEHQGRRIDSFNNEVTDDFAQVMGVEVRQGRWFEPADDALSYEPVLINERLKRDLFGTEDPLGENIAPKPDDNSMAHNGGKAPPELRVVGVFTDFREDGELSGPEPYFFRRSRIAGPDAKPYYNLVVRVRPGTPAAFEESLMDRLRAVSPGHTFQVDPLAKMRRSMMRLRLVPMLSAALIAGFMLIMVALGMVGVLWQSVARPRPAIGPPRAVGAPRPGVSLQVLGELLVVATAGLLLGAALAVQVPLLGVIGWVSNGVYAVAMALAALTIYGLTVVSALYPSWLATQVQPAEALHYE
jgi:putative ABC transport system permease protein